MEAVQGSAAAKQEEEEREEEVVEEVVEEEEEVEVVEVVEVTHHTMVISINYASIFGPHRTVRRSLPGERKITKMT